MRSQVEFRRKVERICDYALSHGIASVGGSINESNARQFVEAVHQGFGSAQEEIITALLELNRKKKELGLSLKTANRQRNKKSVGELKKALATQDYREQVIRKIADSIAWQLFRHAHHVARRFYMGQPLTPISSSNLQSGIEFVKHFNTSNPQGFALLTDITSFIQIGDVLMLDPNGEKAGLHIVELKEGRVNYENREFLNFYYETGCDRALHYFHQDKGKKQFEQLMRMARQDSRSSKAMSLLNKGSGYDPGTEMDVRISEDTYVLHDYLEMISDLLGQCEEKGWAITVVDDCIMIGAYKAGFPASAAFGGWVRGMGIRYPIVEFRQTFRVPVTLPPFLLPLGKDELMKLTFGEKTIFLCIDFDRLMDMGTGMGMTACWLSPKETARLTTKKVGPFVFDNRCLSFGLGKAQVHVGDGILARMLFEFVRPVSALGLIKHTLEEAAEETMN